MCRIADHPGGGLPEQRIEVDEREVVAAKGLRRAATFRVLATNEGVRVDCRGPRSRFPPAVAHRLLLSDLSTAID